MTDSPKPAIPLELVERIKPWKVIVGAAVALIVGTGSALAYLDQYAKKEWLKAHIAASAAVHESLTEKTQALGERQAATEAHHVDFKETLQGIRGDLGEIRAEVKDIHRLLERRRP